MRANHAIRFVGIVVCCSLATAQEKPAEKESGWQKLFRQHAAGYKVVIEGDEKAEVKLLNDPILHWSQPVRGGADGAVFLWAKEGRPVAIGTLFIWPMGNDKQGISHELHSLSQQPFDAIWKDRKWTPPKDSITWNSLSTAPVPAKTAEQRLRQMRDSALVFKAESQDKNDRKWELRLLPRPIYRYQIPDKDVAVESGVIDGALFGFVEGTDLEAVLLLQARKTPQGNHWEYALARMSDFKLKAMLNNKVVWEVERFSGFDNSRVAYYCSTVESRKSAEEE